MTRFEQIKSMSVLEIAELIQDIEDLDKLRYCKYKNECDEMLNADIDIPRENCVKCCIEWLQEETN